MEFDFNLLKTITSSIQSIVVSVSIVAGGLWAYRKFKILDEVNKARLENSKLEFENNTFIKQLQEFPGIHTDVSAHQLQPTDSAEFVAEVSVLIENKGESTVKIDLRNDSLAVCQVLMNEKCETVFGNERILEVPSSDNPNDLPLNFHPAAIRASTVSVTP